MLINALPPIKVNHGKVFNDKDNWYTFYCPNEKCKTTWGGESKCRKCGQDILVKPKNT